MIFMATIEDIVRVSGASRSTVFRFLNGNNVRKETKDAIIKAMEKLDYKNEVIYKHKDVTIEISLAKDFEHFMGFTEIIHGITTRATEKGIKVNLVIRTGNDIDTDYANWDSINEMKGVIVVGKSIEDEEKEAKMLKLKNIPHIFANRLIDDDVSYVAVDLKKAAYDLTCHLIKLGHKDIAIVGNIKNMRADKAKLEGYKAALSDNGIEVSDKYYHEVNNNGDFEKAIECILQGERLPTAYFGICDSHAMKFIYMAQSKGIKVPQDISVVGMDDIENVEYFKPALTTVYIPFEKIGRIAVDNLLKLITDSEVACLKTIIKHSIVLRESCLKIKNFNK